MDFFALRRSWRRCCVPVIVRLSGWDPRGNRNRKYSGFFTRDRSSFHNSVYPRTDRFRGRILFSRICPLPFREESFAASVIRIDILQRLLPRDGYMGSLERCQCQENAAAVSAIFNSGLAVASVFLPDSRIGGY